MLTWDERRYLEQQQIVRRGLWRHILWYSRAALLVYPVVFGVMWLLLRLVHARKHLGWNDLASLGLVVPLTAAWDYWDALRIMRSYERKRSHPIQAESVPSSK